MDKLPVNLGVCFSGHQLYYALNDVEKLQTLERIGKVDFNFDTHAAILSGDKDSFTGIITIMERLIKQYDVKQLRCLYPATLETWASLPKSVYDQSAERESYLRILKHGESRQQLEPFWYDINNRDFRFLSVRNKLQTRGFQRLGELFQSHELCSEFELGVKWLYQTRVSDAFKTIGCYENHVVVSSFVMGKFRAATYIRFKYIDDLSYMWLQHASNLGWLNGVHDSIFFYGPNAYKVTDVLQSLFDAGAKTTRLDKLTDMQVSAKEETYGFSLEEAFPAIILAL